MSDTYFEYFPVRTIKVVNARLLLPMLENNIDDELTYKKWLQKQREKKKERESINWAEVK